MPIHVYLILFVILELMVSITLVLAIAIVENEGFFEVVVVGVHDGAARAFATREGRPCLP